METLRVDSDSPLFHGADLGIKNVFRDANNILPLVILEEIQMLQGGYDVLLSDARHLTDLPETKNAINIITVPCICSIELFIISVQSYL